MAKNISTILVTPVTTEKAYGLSQKNVYVFDFSFNLRSHHDFLISWAMVAAFSLDLYSVMTWAG